MIKRIVTSQDLRNLCDSFRDFAKTNEINHFGDQKFCVDTIYEAWKHENSLINTCIIYANEVDDYYDSVCWFVTSRDLRINKTVAYSYLWISLNQKNGYLCLKKCLQLINKRKIDFISIGILYNSPYLDKIKKVLFKKGFKDDSVSMFINNNY